MIEYPRKGIYAVGFAMGRAWHELERKMRCRWSTFLCRRRRIRRRDFIFSFPRTKYRRLNMTMEEALKLITSGGLITPDDKNKNHG